MPPDEYDAAQYEADQYKKARKEELEAQLDRTMFKNQMGGHVVTSPLLRGQKISRWKLVLSFVTLVLFAIFVAFARSAT